MRAPVKLLKATTDMHEICLPGILQSHMPAMVLTILHYNRRQRIALAYPLLCSDMHK